MNLRKLGEHLKRLEYLDWLILRKQTGTPKQLATKLEISERSTYNYINFLKNELEAPVIYDRNRGSYRYKTQGKLYFKWE